jgi:hypothetical protein
VPRLEATKFIPSGIGTSPAFCGVGGRAVVEPERVALPEPILQVFVAAMHVFPQGFPLVHRF